jgi:archaellum component FlaC
MSRIEEAKSEETVTYLFPDFQLLHTIFSKDECQVVEITCVEIYIVEQWACDRRYSSVITAFTGDSEHKVRCGQVKLPKDQSKWSAKVSHFFREIQDYGGRLKETEQGYLFITNLSSVPSHLNLIPVPCGSVMEVWDYFKVNVNLKRMNCGGRSALFLCAPSDATEDKFRQIFKTHPKVDIMYSVRELVILVQICLVDFKLLDPGFVDGLLCNKTEQNIMQWWNLYGSSYYGIAPREGGILDPSTVSAILGFVLSCHYRFDMASIDFPKEPFNYFSFRVIVGKFQKQYNLERTWYLDPLTVEKLFRVTSKISNSDISKLKNVVKLRVHDISGKASSERVAQEVLTTDLEKAVKYFNCSPRLEFLWYGKGDPRDLKQFEYYEKIQASMMSASALKTGVGKIRNLPKRLQAEDYIPRRKNDKSIGSKSDQETSEYQSCDIIEEKRPEVCKVILADDEVCKRELKKCTSFPYVRQELNVPQLEYENHGIDLKSPISSNMVLKRSKSCSFLSGTLWKWDTMVSPIFIANQLKKLEWELMCHADGCTKLLNERMEYKSSWERCHSKMSRINQLIKPVMSKYETQIQMDQRYHSKLEDISTTGSRLEYEMRLLGTRVRDAEESVNSFEQKVLRLEKSIQGVSPNSAKSEDDGYPWYNRLDMDRVKPIWHMLEQFGPVRWVLGNVGTIGAFDDKKNK